MSYDFNSLNKETGLLEDIGEVRELAIGLAEFIIMMVNHQVLSIFIPEIARLDAIALAVTAESMLRQTSQAEYLRNFGRATGDGKEFVEDQIRLQNLSETLPMTHPDAPHPAPLDINDPAVMQMIFAEIARQRGVKMPPVSPTPEEHVELPPNLENFLKSLSFGEKEPPYDDKGESTD